MWIKSMLAATALSGPIANPISDQPLQRLAKSIEGRLGACVQPLGSAATCVNGDKRFPLQSVMKLIVAAVVLDQVDKKKFDWHDTIHLTAQDASPGPQEFAHALSREGGRDVTIEDLVRRSIIDSDSTAIDALIVRIGGLGAVKSYLEEKAIGDIRIDRNERDLQAEFSGLKWKPEFSDSKIFDSAVASVPSRLQDRALALYAEDPRDTASPRGMARFLARLQQGDLLSKDSTERLIAIMMQTVTGIDRLKAGVPKDWRLAHKTGTSADWKGISAATNDVGLLFGPDKRVLAIAVFVAQSKATKAEREAVIAEVAKYATSGGQSLSNGR